MVKGLFAGSGTLKTSDEKIMQPTALLWRGGERFVEHPWKVNSVDAQGETFTCLFVRKVAAVVNDNTDRFGSMEVDFIFAHCFDPPADGVSNLDIFDAFSGFDTRDFIWLGDIHTKAL